jgi:hypothetical protein
MEKMDKISSKPPKAQNRGMKDKRFPKYTYQNAPPNLGIKTEISRLWSIPDHQEGIRCKAPRSDD